MLAKQLPLHKKMLAVLQAKKAPPAEQSKKMKEIISAQTRSMELKKEMKNLAEEIEREREAVERDFCPSKKWGAGADGGSCGAAANRSLDMRTTFLKVKGFCHEVVEDAIREHFSKIGTVTSVRLDIPDELPGNINGQSEYSFALVNFASRADAERAMASDAKFDGRTLTCTWHNPTSSSSTSINSCAHSVGNREGSESMYAAGHDANDDLYDDVGDTCPGKEQQAEEASVPDDDKIDPVYNEEDDYLVDYD